MLSPSAPFRTEQSLIYIFSKIIFTFCATLLSGQNFIYDSSS